MCTGWLAAAESGEGGCGASLEIDSALGARVHSIGPAGYYLKGELPYGCSSVDGVEPACVSAATSVRY